MPASVPYCDLTDLDWGTIPAPANADYWLNSSADEIDSKIGFVYATPVILGNSSEQRPARLLLKRINAWLAMGRAILSIDAGNEDDQLHQLGLYYVNQASSALDAIASGTIVLVGADLATPASDKQTGPMITNIEDSSLVESFGSTFGDPAKTVLNAPRFPAVTSDWFQNPYTW